MKNFLFTLLLFICGHAVHAQEKTFQLSTHILDISLGQPAPGVPIRLDKWNEANQSWNKVAEKQTDQNGRIKDFLPGESNPGIYKLTFLTKKYFQARKSDSFYPFIEVVFEIKDSNHYHVPITLSPFGYSTYRGN